MRLWSLHPKYLDRFGLVALWREGLLAQAVLRGGTRGYRSHPQLTRFRDHAAPLAAISAYLQGVYLEGMARGYTFDLSKIGPCTVSVVLTVTTGQMAYEWDHLLAKLMVRDLARYEKLRGLDVQEAHPVFEVVPGEVEPWERP
jgi:hypothetical protein